MRDDTVQMQMIRRYARILREHKQQFSGPRIGARERHAMREAATTPRAAAGARVASPLDVGRSDPTAAG